LLTDWITSIASVVSAAGVLVAARQLSQSKRQARTDFEDRLASEYRQIALALPLTALLGEPLTYVEHQRSLEHFYHYFDLCNEQVFLHQNQRVSSQTWLSWRDGIRSNMRRPAFAKAWQEIKRRSGSDFQELRELEASDYGGPGGP
jgi:hypothetical protein